MTYHLVCLVSMFPPVLPVCTTYVCVHLLTLITAELPLGVSGEDIPTTGTPGLYHFYMFVYIY